MVKPAVPGTLLWKLGKVPDGFPANSVDRRILEGLTPLQEAYVFYVASSEPLSLTEGSQVPHAVLALGWDARVKCINTVVSYLSTNRPEDFETLVYQRIERDQLELDRLTNEPKYLEHRIAKMREGREIVNRMLGGENHDMNKFRFDMILKGELEHIIHSLKVLLGDPVNNAIYGELLFSPASLGRELSQPDLSRLVFLASFNCPNIGDRFAFAVSNHYRRSRAIEAIEVRDAKKDYSGALVPLRGQQL
ncbi:MAG: hypothetical protein ABIJ34_01795 [archaeon]